jgi:hypothetical protein
MGEQVKYGLIHIYREENAKISQDIREMTQDRELALIFAEQDREGISLYFATDGNAAAADLLNAMRGIGDNDNLGKFYDQKWQETGIKSVKIIEDYHDESDYRNHCCVFAFWTVEVDNYDAALVELKVAAPVEQIP